MNYKKIESKWQKIWDKEKLYKFNKENTDKKYYVLEMLPYPSGAKLHVGHWYNYGPSDTFARFKKMQGYEVFQPMGFDAFGLPAENYAIKTGIHPETSTIENMARMEETLKKMGTCIDWEYEIKTCMPNYYKWTQYLFLQFYKKGLAYRKNAPVNWCSSCNTVLANEQVLDNKCERCGTEITRKNLTQWFFKITDYAEELLQGLDTIDWPEKTKAMQKNWIGKSTGCEVSFKTENGNSFSVFTTRIDTICGVSYVVLSPEHELVDKLTVEKYKQDVEKYKLEASKATEIERLSSTREKTGCFTGSYCINPINNKKIPIWISDYVLSSYGTGAVMGVPAHDERDFEFAKKYNLEIVPVIEPADKVKKDLPFVEYGTCINSGIFSGLSSEKAKEEITKLVEKERIGKSKINYRLRDWLISRQRYWGCPIPIIHCPNCGEVPVNENDLPVKLPFNVNFKPDGKSPLAECEEFINTICPKCGQKAKREADTLDTFVCSSWYFLRYPDANNKNEAFDSNFINKMLPVDKYIGGAEHACMHLLYARFFTKALRDMGFLNFDEPFLSLVHQGTILGPDGYKMSKSRGNVISPDEYVSKIGSDPFRMYLMFGFSYIEGGPWSENGIDSIVKFLDRLVRLFEEIEEKNHLNDEMLKNEKDLNYARNYAIKRINEDLPNFSFNTSIARIMEYVNAIYAYNNEAKETFNLIFYKECLFDLVKLLAPFAPHISEELNEMLGNKISIFKSSFPQHDEKALVKDEYELAVQINSKIKCKILVSPSMLDEEIIKIALNNNQIKEATKGKNIIKSIVIPKRLVNFVVK